MIYKGFCESHVMTRNLWLAWTIQVVGKNLKLKKNPGEAIFLPSESFASRRLILPAYEIGIRYRPSIICLFYSNLLAFRL